uniref:Uncharacterized protein n=1 Tax=Arundo donax TaxID=35708 RepID=A0A0A8YTP8_ARUDO
MLGCQGHQNKVKVLYSWKSTSTSCDTSKGKAWR